MSYVTAVDCVVVDPTAVGPSTDACPPATDGGCEGVDAPVTESGTGTISSANDKGCVDVDGSAVESCPFVADKWCEDVDGSAVESCPFVADKWCEDVDGSIVQSCTGTSTWLPFAEGGAASLDRAESGKSADWSNGNKSCGGDLSDDDDEYCEGVVPPGGLSLSRGIGAANTRLRIERTRSV